MHGAVDVMNDKKEEVLRNEILYSTLAKLQLTDTNNTNQIAYVVRRANLSSTVVLAAVSLLLTAKEKLPGHIERLRKDLAESPKQSAEYAEGKLEAALSLFNSPYMLFSISLILASKYLIDRSYINRTWANILMIEKDILNEYEWSLLEVFEYKIELKSTSLEDLLSKLDRSLIKKEKKESKLFKSIRKIASCIFKTH